MFYVVAYSNRSDHHHYYPVLISDVHTYMLQYPTMSCATMVAVHVHLSPIQLPSQPVFMHDTLLFNTRIHHCVQVYH